jgi:hypothetical protein
MASKEYQRNQRASAGRRSAGGKLEGTSVLEQGERLRGAGVVKRTAEDVNGPEPRAHHNPL